MTNPAQSARGVSEMRGAGSTVADSQRRSSSSAGAVHRMSAGNCVVTNILVRRQERTTYMKLSTMNIIDSDLPTHRESLDYQEAVFTDNEYLTQRQLNWLNYALSTSTTVEDPEDLFSGIDPRTEEGAGEIIERASAEVSRCKARCEEIITGRREPYFGGPSRNWKLGCKVITAHDPNLEDTGYFWSEVRSVGDPRAHGDMKALRQGFALVVGEVLVLQQIKYDHSIRIPWAEHIASVTVTPVWNRTRFYLDLDDYNNICVRVSKTGEHVDAIHFSENIQKLVYE